ncbi:MAG: hypothetical protein ACLR8L_00085 [Oscillospiraceae bacterium]
MTATARSGIGNTAATKGASLRRDAGHGDHEGLLDGADGGDAGDQRDVRPQVHREIVEARQRGQPLAHTITKLNAG